jgi:hypothetical protein
MTIAEFDRHHATADALIVIPGHERETDIVVHARDEYVVVSGSAKRR